MTAVRAPRMRLSVPAWSLPRLSAAVPQTVLPGPLAVGNATIAGFLLGAQVFDEADIPTTWDDPLQACEQAMARCLRRAIGPLHCLRPAFGLDVLDEDGHAIGRWGQGHPLDKPRAYRSVELYWGETQEHEWPIGEGVEALEAAIPGLGRTVLQVLCERSAQVYPLFTPDAACDAARYVYWCGEDSEDAALDAHCGDDPQEREAMRSEMLTRDALDQCYPVWAQRWPGGAKRLRTERYSLQRAARTATDARVRRIVADTQQLRRLRCDDRFRPDIEGEYIGFGAVLSWQEDDVTVRIYDDLLQLAHQGECCTHMGQCRIALDDPGALGAWLQAMRPRFQAIRLIDRLIHELAA